MMMVEKETMGIETVTMEIETVADPRQKNHYNYLYRSNGNRMYCNKKQNRLMIVHCDSSNDI